METKSTEQNAVLDQKIENIIINKVHLLIAIVTFMVPVIWFFFRIQLDIALIKQNHEAHMEKAITEINELKKSDSRQDDILSKQNDSIIRLLEINGR